MTGDVKHAESAAPPVPRATIAIQGGHTSGQNHSRVSASLQSLFSIAVSQLCVKNGLLNAFKDV
jgi:hypothetical protein